MGYLFPTFLVTADQIADIVACVTVAAALGLLLNPILHRIGERYIHGCHSCTSYYQDGIVWQSVSIFRTSSPPSISIALHAIAAPAAAPVTFFLRPLLPAFSRATTVLTLIFFGAVRTARLRGFIEFFPHRIFFEEPRVGAMRAFILLLRLVPTVAQRAAFAFGFTVITARTGILRLVVERRAKPVFLKEARAGARPLLVLLRRCPPLRSGACCQRLALEIAFERHSLAPVDLVERLFLAFERYLLPLVPPVQRRVLKPMPLTRIESGTA